MTKINFEYAVEAYQDGMSFTEIARKFNANPNSVKEGLIRRKVEIRHGKPSKASLIGEKTFRKLYLEDKLSVRDIADKVRISTCTIRSALKEYGIPIRPRSVCTSLTFDNGKRKRVYSRQTSGGYIELTIPNYPGCRAYGRVFEHLVVWEKANGRIPKGWVIHHLNGIKDDNRIENLAIFPNAGHGRVENGVVFKKRIRELENELRKLKTQLRLEVY